MKIKLNEDKELVAKIDKGLNDNFKKYGKRYCPCSVIRNDDTVCPCKEFREMDNTGLCHCEKWEKTEV